MNHLLWKLHIQPPPGSPSIAVEQDNDSSGRYSCCFDLKRYANACEVNVTLDAITEQYFIRTSPALFLRWERTTDALIRPYHDVNIPILQGFGGVPMLAV